MAERLMENIKRLNCHGTLVERNSITTQVTFEFNRLKNIQNSQSNTSSLQVLKDSRLGISTTTRANDYHSLLESSLATAEFGSKVNYELPEPNTPPNPTMWDQKVKSLNLTEMIEIGEDLVKFAAALDPSINGFSRAKKVITKKSVKNTKGLNSSWEKSSYVLFVGGELTESQSFLSVYEYDMSIDTDMNPEAMKAGLKNTFNLAKKNVPVENKSYPVLFTPGAFSDVIAPVLACLDGKAVVRGISPLKERIGESVFSPSLTILEDGVLDRGIGSNLFDDQGSLCRKTHLIEHGKLNGYLLDLETANTLNMTPTGTGYAAISPNNLLVLPGDSSKNEIIRNMKEGLIIDNTMGTWSGNPYSGQVTGNIALGFLVRHGEPVGRVKDCMFSLNVFSHLLDNLEALTWETKCLGNEILPYALINDVSIATKS